MEKIMNINEVINQFYKILEIGQNLKLVSSDINLIAIKELKVMLLGIDYTKDDYNMLDDSLALLRNRGFIYNYEKLSYGFKLLPQNKIYISDNDLIVEFNKDNLIENNC